MQWTCLDRQGLEGGVSTGPAQAAQQICNPRSSCCHRACTTLPHGKPAGVPCMVHVPLRTSSALTSMDACTLVKGGQICLTVTKALRRILCLAQIWSGLASGRVHHAPSPPNAEHALGYLGQNAPHGDQAVLLILHVGDLDPQMPQPDLPHACRVKNRLGGARCGS